MAFVAAVNECCEPRKIDGCNQMRCDATKSQRTNDSLAPQNDEKRKKKKSSQGGVDADEGLVMLGRGRKRRARVLEPPPFGPRADAVNITTQLASSCPRSRKMQCCAADQGHYQMLAALLAPTHMAHCTGAGMQRQWQAAGRRERLGTAPQRTGKKLVSAW